MSEPIVWPTQPPIALSMGPTTEDTRPPPPPEECRRPVASPWTRAGGFGLEVVLMACTFGFGWVGWWIIAWADGQTPAKVVLHLHVVNADDGRTAPFRRMAIREALGKAPAGVAGLAGLAFGWWWLLVPAAAYLAAGAAIAFTDVRRRTLWDRLARTVVLEGDPPLATVLPPTAPVEAGIALG